MSADPRHDDGLRAAGINVIGVLSKAVYDAVAEGAWRAASRLPGARCAIVLGTGGRAFGAARASSPEASETADPVDRYTRRVVEAYVDRLVDAGTEARAAFYWEQCEGKHLDFVALGVRAGLGVTGRLGVLLHPELGPWLALRAVVLCGRDFAPTPALHGFDPCTRCAAPCAQACPAGALGRSGSGQTIDADLCTAARLSPNGCTTSCVSRAACVLGRDHAYAPADEAHYMASVVDALRRAHSEAEGA